MASTTDELVLICCAGGKQAQALIPHLYNKGKRLRLNVNSTSSEERLKKQFPNADIIRADLGDTASSKKLIQGVTTIFYVGPSMHPHETELGYSMIDAALAESKTGNFKHFVYSSVISTQLRKLMNHDCKRYVEEYLMESGLNYTILQPSHFLEMTPVAMLMKQDEPVFPTPYNADTVFSFTAVRDLAEAAAIVIQEREKHYFALYPILSTMPMARTKLIEIIGKAIGKPIPIKQQSLEEGVEFILQVLFAGKEVDPRALDIAERLMWYYNRRGILGNPTVAEWLLGRKTTTCEEWVDMQVEAFKESQ